MARPPTCHNPCRNSPPTGEDKPAGPARTEDSDTYTSALAVSCAPIPAPPATFILALAPAAVDSMVRYLEADLQQILRIILETRPLAIVPQSLVFPDGPCKRPLKARFPELYYSKTHIRCYNFIQ